MSTCGSCPLYWHESIKKNGVSLGMACPGNESREDCADRLLDYIDKQQDLIKEKDLQIAEHEWQWHETERDVWMSHHDWPRDITWAIIRVQVERGPRQKKTTEYEVNFMLTNPKNFCSKDVWQNKVMVKMCQSLDEAKTWIYGNHEKYPGNQ